MRCQTRTMSIVSTLQGLQTPALLLLTIFGPSLLPRAIQLVTRQRTPQPQLQRPPRAPIPLLGKLVIAAFTLWGIASLVFPPYDIFTSNNLPILVSNDALRRVATRRAAAAAAAGANSLHPAQWRDDPSEMESLLAKLLNLDNRYLYARYGHEAMAGCSWCHGASDYALVSLAADTLGPYILVLMVLAAFGFQQIGGAQASDRKDAWRGSFAWIVGVLLVGEVVARYLWDIQAVDGDCVHVRPRPSALTATSTDSGQLATIIHTVRTLALMLLPIAYVLLPLPTPDHPPMSVLLAPLAQAQNTIRLTSLTRSAIARSDQLRTMAHAHSSQTAGLVHATRADPSVTLAAEQFGLRPETIAQSGGSWIRSAWSNLVQVQPEPARPP